jgi:hypothetical protein
VLLGVTDRHPYVQMKVSTNVSAMSPGSRVKHSRDSSFPQLVTRTCESTTDGQSGVVQMFLVYSARKKNTTTRDHWSAQS